MYINGSAAFYKHVGGTAAAALLQGKWLKAPANSGELASLAELTNLSKLIDTALSNHGTIAKGSVTTIEGQKAIALNDTTKGGTLYVATTGTPYPLQISKSGTESGKVVLNRWDEPVTLSAPPGRNRHQHASERRLISRFVCMSICAEPGSRGVAAWSRGSSTRDASLGPVKDERVLSGWSDAGQPSSTAPRSRSRRRGRVDGQP